MNGHSFDTTTQICLGCDLTMMALRDAPIRKPDERIAACPAVTRLINDPDAGILAVIAAPDRLIITSGGGVILRLGADAVRAIFETAAPMLRRWTPVGDTRVR